MILLLLFVGFAIYVIVLLTAPAASSQQRPSHWPLISSQRRGVAQTMPTIPGASHEQPTLSFEM
jgi:hypothetical protein